MELVAFRIGPDLLEKIDKFADKNNLDRSQALRILLGRSLADDDQELLDSKLPTVGEVKELIQLAIGNVPQSTIVKKAKKERIGLSHSEMAELAGLSIHTPKQYGPKGKPIKIGEITYHYSKDDGGWSSTPSAVNTNG